MIPVVIYTNIASPEQEKIPPGWKTFIYVYPRQTSEKRSNGHPPLPAGTGRHTRRHLAGYRFGGRRQSAHHSPAHHQPLDRHRPRKKPQAAFPKPGPSGGRDPAGAYSLLDAAKHPIVSTKPSPLFWCTTSEALLKPIEQPTGRPLPRHRQQTEGLCRPRLNRCLLFSTT